MNSNEKNKKVQNPFPSLQNDPKSVFDMTNKFSKSLIKKQEQHFMIKTKFL